MERSTQDALAIWRAGVDAVRADRVLRDSLRWDGRVLGIQDSNFDLTDARRLIIVGAGKAGGGMLQGLFDVLNRRNSQSPMDIPEVCGWINVPQGAIPEPLLRDSDGQDWVHRIQGVSICEARPSGVNEPTARVLAGTQEILKLVSEANTEDVVVFLLSGGGSALLSAPHEWLDLDTKIAITRAMSSRGAGIQQLNAVRRALSQVKGGGLLRRCSAGKLITLVISDVLGDPLEMIGSGPTVLDPAPDPMLAAGLLEQFAPGEFPQVVSKLREIGSMCCERDQESKDPGAIKSATSAHLFVLANNATAVDAAAKHAARLGYRVQRESRLAGEGSAGVSGAEFASKLMGLERNSVWISGGEPTVVLPEASVRGLGGRNQHLVLSAARALLSQPPQVDFLGSIQRGDIHFAFVSGGTDGEDGSTAVAGAWIDSPWLLSNHSNAAPIDDALSRCDSNGFFQQSGGLLDVGPTHTNVCDLRVALKR
jgi:hydroxypyruvate reductase